MAGRRGGIRPLPGSAYAEFRRGNDPAQAAAVAGSAQPHLPRANLGNRAAAAGWLARAARLVDEFELAPLAGWVALIRAGGSADPAEAEQLAGEALESARRFADADLELCALSQMGSSLVTMGRVAEGIELLDEAMAGSLGGEGGSLNTVVFTSCQMMISCSRAAEYERQASGSAPPTISPGATDAHSSTRSAAPSTAGSCSPRAAGRRPRRSSWPP